MPDVHEVRSKNHLIAYIISGADPPRDTMFVTPPEANLQVGFVVKKAGFNIPRHDHKPIDRNLVGTPEVLVVRQGRCEIEFFDERRRFLERREAMTGDVVVLLAGGHGFKIHEDTVFLEVKQGPYPGVEEKDQF